MDIIEAQVSTKVVQEPILPTVVGVVNRAWNTREIGEDKQFHYPILHTLEEQIKSTLDNVGIDYVNGTISPITGDVDNKAARKFRADLRKVMDALKTESTREKEKILEEYRDFETKLKQVLGHLEVSDATLKAAIDEYTQEGYKALEKELESYWGELTQAAGIDFYPFSRLGIKVISSTSKNKEITKMQDAIESINYQKELLYSTSPIADRVWQEFINPESVGYLDLKQSVAEVNRRMEIARQEQQHVEAMKAAVEEPNVVVEPIMPEAPKVAPTPAPTPTAGKAMNTPVSVGITLTGDAEIINTAIEMLKTMNLLVDVEQKTYTSVQESLF